MNNKKGFTLAELLVVVAIIAVLVAIAIPVFSTQLEKAREATDLTNIRAAYAKILTAVNTEDKTNGDGLNEVAYIKSGNGTEYWYMYVDATMSGESGGWLLGNNPSNLGNPVTIGGGDIMCNISNTRWTIYYAKRTSGSSGFSCIDYESSFWE